MVRFAKHALILYGLAIGAPQEANADSEGCTPGKQFSESFKDATAAEKDGNLALAFAAYDVARDRGGAGCDGPTQTKKDAQTAWKRAGQRLAKDAEAKGDFFAYGSMTRVTTQVTRSFGPDWSWSVWKDAGAFQWYGAIDEPAEADRVMFLHAQSRPKDLVAAQTALTHLTMPGRIVDANADFAGPLLEVENQARSHPEDQQLQKRVHYLHDLQKIARGNVDEALRQEESAYGKYKPREMVLGQTPIEDSLRHLGVARDWYSLFGDPKADKVAELAGKRGDAMMQDQRPKSFSSAKSYYDLGKLSEKSRELTAQANKLGDIAAKKGEYDAAVRYYEIGHSDTGENEDKITDLRSRLASEIRTKEQAQQKALQDMTKDENKKKEFKKGQDDLEKELGL